MMSIDLDGLRQEIVKGRRELDELWSKRYDASLSGVADEEWDARFELGKVALDHCSQIANYIRQVNPFVANEIDERVKMATQDLQGLGPEKRLDTLHLWYKNDLAPLLNKAEQEDYLVSQLMKQKPQ